MASVLWQGLPRALSLPGGPCPIETDFRAYVRLTETLLREEATTEERLAACLALFRQKPTDLAAGLSALLTFYRQGAPVEEDRTGKERRSVRPVLSYEVDAWYIQGAFRAAYGLDLLTVPYLHWWEFCGLLAALPGDCPLKQRMYYRSLVPGEIKDPAERRRVRRIQKALALPGRVLTDGEIGAVLGKEGGMDAGR